MNQALENPAKAAQNYQTQLFEILEEYFQRATGCKPEDFAKFSTFASVVRAKRSMIGARAELSLPWAYDELSLIHI